MRYEKIAQVYVDITMKAAKARSGAEAGRYGWIGRCWKPDTFNWLVEVVLVSWLVLLLLLLLLLVLLRILSIQSWRDCFSHSRLQISVKSKQAHLLSPCCGEFGTHTRMMFGMNSDSSFT